MGFLILHEKKILSSNSLTTSCVRGHITMRPISRGLKFNDFEKKKSNKETKVNLIMKLLLVFLASKDKINKMK